MRRHHHLSRTALALTAAAGLVTAGCSTAGKTAGGADAEAAPRAKAASPSPSTLGAFRDYCRKKTHTGCYTFDQLRTAYGIDELQKKGVTGKKQKIAVLDLIGAPNVEQDLKEFSSQLGLPAPKLKIVEQKPASGKTATFNWKSSAMVTQAKETTMDLQAAHAMAPDAELVLYQVDLTQKDAEAGINPNALEALSDGIGRLARAQEPDVISMSFVSNEGGPEGKLLKPAFKEMQPKLAKIAQQGTTLVAASGDNGAKPAKNEKGKAVKSVAWPASDPSVTAVGGSRLSLDDQGERTRPDVVWSDRPGAGGGGLSTVFSRPEYQDRVKETADTHRAVPDVSLTASGDGSTLIYFTDNHGGSWQPALGTSLATPLFAGIIALADQQAGTRLGNVNPALYRLAADPESAKKAGIIDITSGTNGKGGYRAGPGYDLASGLGTVDAPKLVSALAAPRPN